ncbi:BufA1 family periplasmic bufferin-type metallophore [Alteromonas macleodii]|uniref:DUF2282 domain-containing protein n=1 Tax=Alteromonas macleodii TaxID=28108 RepID=A0AB36FQX3_ALTMA|nr:DUF2282 domain-containing protein [Alteromonas macleodii]OES24444.1 hypothetical protein BFV95_4711 [Alteromonas macleodii]OES25501.1 hypothetical protein BFV94_4354 [Alteromonas macleodii]OES25803.1 hypothetical protein BFV93_4266 [Alteromonas macleodii]OES38677.1 hypothetical protein BFV96_4788 [Alteromonas macleodii]
MSNQNKMIHATVASILTLGVSLNAAASVPEQPKEWEKCAGVAKAGKNDCGAIDGSHGCAGMAKKDASKNDWVWVPAGTCEKIVGGEVKAKKPAKG